MSKPQTDKSELFPPEINPASAACSNLSDEVTSPAL